MKAYIINLPDEHEKLNRTMSELTKVPNIVTEVEVIRAYKTAPGWHGCRESHLYALSQAPHEPFMIVEDDFVFCVDNPEEVIKSALSQLQDKAMPWAGLWLGATLNEPIKRVDQDLLYLTGAFTTHAIIWNGASKAISDILDSRANEHKIDVYLKDVIQEQYNCFLTRPMVANQRNGFSHIRNKDVNTGDLIAESYKKYAE